MPASHPSSFHLLLLILTTLSTLLPSVSAIPPHLTPELLQETSLVLYDRITHRLTDPSAVGLWSVQGKFTDVYPYPLNPVPKLIVIYDMSSPRLQSPRRRARRTMVQDYSTDLGISWHRITPYEQDVTMTVFSDDQDHWAQWYLHWPLLQNQLTLAQALEKVAPLLGDPAKWEIFEWRIFWAPSHPFMNVALILPLDIYYHVGIGIPEDHPPGQLHQDWMRSSKRYILVGILHGGVYESPTTDATQYFANRPRRPVRLFPGIEADNSASAPGMVTHNTDIVTLAQNIMRGIKIFRRRNPGAKLLQVYTAVTGEVPGPVDGEGDPLLHHTRVDLTFENTDQAANDDNLSLQFRTEEPPQWLQTSRATAAWGTWPLYEWTVPKSIGTSYRPLIFEVTQLALGIYKAVDLVGKVMRLTDYTVTEMRLLTKPQQGGGILATLPDDMYYIFTLIPNTGGGEGRGMPKLVYVGIASKQIYVDPKLNAENRPVTVPG